MTFLWWPTQSGNIRPSAEGTNALELRIGFLVFVVHRKENVFIIVKIYNKKNVFF